MSYYKFLVINDDNHETSKIIMQQMIQVIKIILTKDVIQLIIMKRFVVEHAAQKDHFGETQK